MINPLVTVIISTYNRPDVLYYAISSVLNQSITEWQLYVIGDNCEDSTKKVVEKFDDSRIKYINLPDRFGEQSGPNSVGIAIADTPFTAFLNHDDVWLSDHLEKGLSVLKNKKYNFYLGGYATSAFLEEDQKEGILHVDRVVTNDRRPIDFFKQKLSSYEPASSWIVDSKLIKETGYWNYFKDLYRYPIEDYILRAWRMGAKFYFSEKINVWYVLTHHQKNNNNNTYSRIGNEHNLINQILLSKSPEEIRKILLQKVKLWNELPQTERNKLIIKTSFNSSHNNLSMRDKFYLFRQKIFRAIYLGTVSGYLFRYTGLDTLKIKCQFLKQDKGAALNKAIIKRTGIVPPKPNRNEVIQRVLKELKNV